MRGFYERFEIERLRYGVGASDAGQIAFWLDGGVTRRGACRKDSLFRDLPVFDDVNLLSVHPMRLFRIVRQHVEAWIGREKPYQFYFAPVDARRAAIYRWLIARAACRLPDYWYYEMGGTFYFFRRAPAIQAQSGPPKDVHANARQTDDSMPVRTRVRGRQ